MPRVTKQARIDDLQASLDSANRAVIDLHAEVAHTRSGRSQLEGARDQARRDLVRVTDERDRATAQYEEMYNLATTAERERNDARRALAQLGMPGLTPKQCAQAWWGKDYADGLFAVVNTNEETP